MMVLLSAAVLTTFLAGVVLGMLVASRYDTKRKVVVLSLVSFLLTCAATATSLGSIPFGIALSLLAMGAVNGVFQRDGEVSIGVSYMTGALVKTGQRLAKAIQGGPRWEWVPYALLWISLALGATLGSLVHQAFGNHGAWVAAVYAVILTLGATTIRVLSPQNVSPTTPQNPTTNP
jgi:uncharacterized membrane protein YoaK (UPF0700 family)